MLIFYENKTDFTECLQGRQETEGDHINSHLLNFRNFSSYLITFKAREVTKVKESECRNSSNHRSIETIGTEQNI